MDYKKAYHQLMDAIMDDTGSIEASTLKKIKNIHEEVKENREQPKETETAYQKDKSKREQKAEIMAIKDNGQRQKAIKENVHLFK